MCISISCCTSNGHPKIRVCVNEGIYENDIIRRDACLDGFAIRLPSSSKLTGIAVQ